MVQCCNCASVFKFELKFPRKKKIKMFKLKHNYDDVISLRMIQQQISELTEHLGLAERENDQTIRQQMIALVSIFSFNANHNSSKKKKYIY